MLMRMYNNNALNEKSKYICIKITHPCGTYMCFGWCNKVIYAYIQRCDLGRRCVPIPTTTYTKDGI